MDIPELWDIILQYASLLPRYARTCKMFNMVTKNSSWRILDRMNALYPQWRNIEGNVFYRYYLNVMALNGEWECFLFLVHNMDGASIPYAMDVCHAFEEWRMSSFVGRKLSRYRDMRELPCLYYLWETGHKKKEKITRERILSMRSTDTYTDWIGYIHPRMRKFIMGNREMRTHLNSIMFTSMILNERNNDPVSVLSRKYPHCTHGRILASLIHQNNEYISWYNRNNIQLAAVIWGKHRPLSRGMILAIYRIMGENGQIFLPGTHPGYLSCPILIRYGQQFWPQHVNESTSLPPSISDAMTMVETL